MFDHFNKIKFISQSVLIVLLILMSRISFADDPPQKKEIGFDEKLGETLPLNLSFLDEYGQPVILKDLFTKPTIFMVVYYRCTGLCSPLMNGVAQVVDELDLQPGKDYNIVTISFDPKETYLMASEKKKNYFDEMKKKIPDNSWHFLTGDSVSDAKITDAIGFRYIKQGNDYIHSTAILTVSPGGKIARYLYGTDFNPFDVKLALVEASEGKTGPTISKLVKLCYSYDAQGRKYVLNITRIAGGSIIIILFAFVAILSIKKKKKNKTDINNGNVNPSLDDERKNLNG
jgi:protein SCO1/2